MTFVGKRNHLIAQSPVMQRVMEDIRKVAASQASVFLMGESGTGKEIMAHAIHHHSARAKGPFIKVNCAAIPATLLESEFFGHEKGAFTGALQRRAGRFELAHRGTLLLDEVSEIPLELQPKLLRVIQEREFERVGSIAPIHVDVRLISTSNRCMKDAVDQKLFREDLYYRLNVVPIYLPPLREHPEDILPLVDHFIDRLGGEKPVLSESAKQLLLEYHWPGNIRELANVVERARVMHPGPSLEREHFQLEKMQRLPPLGMSLQEMERRLILQTLQDQGHNRTRTAKVLGISIRTLRNKLRNFV